VEKLFVTGSKKSNARHLLHVLRHRPVVIMSVNLLKMKTVVQSVAAASPATRFSLTDVRHQSVILRRKTADMTVTEL
jgi:hypothetical protein